ncbi:Adenine phosphoribosyltransferase [Atribacter laminatus]|jgi:adenine phosphoribosyltransferase|uniref:Adenine phosphoribosyltransferase n=2 Tax=Atribacter laminatus TaxID=2847778 RepID=A0A7T1AMP4_ATRLM|nr:Adenine phosphoribosyltransferase [Atribacter laminatus]
MKGMKEMDLASIIRNIPDFPKAGIQFKDITTLLKNHDAFRQAVDSLYHLFKDQEVDIVVGIEARGFILGSVVAYLLDAGFVPVRKKGKLPAAVRSKTYDLEYGSATLEMHLDAIEKNQKVVIIDDLLATGGTVRAVCEMIEEAGGEIAGIAFLIELESLQGRKAIDKYQVYSLIKLD